MNSFLDKIAKKEILVSDGAIGSLLFEKGLKSGDAPERVNLDNPNLLSEIAQSYIDAGAEIIQTNTFGGSRLKLADYDLDSHIEEINQNAVKAIKNISYSNIFISGSIGPSGKLLKPYGEIKPDELFENYRKQVEILIEAGIDLVCFETMTDLNEITIAIKAARDISKSIPIIASMTFDVIPQGSMTIMGNSIPDVCKSLKENGANVIGSNCGNGIDNMLTIAKEFASNTDLPIIIQSNAGVPTIVDHKVKYLETPEQFAGFANDLVSLGVSIIGGCCGTTPSHINAISKSIKN